MTFIVNLLHVLHGKSGFEGNLKNWVRCLLALKVVHRTVREIDI